MISERFRFSIWRLLNNGKFPKSQSHLPNSMNYQMPWACSKRPAVSPAQPVHAKTCLPSGKAAAALTGGANKGVREDDKGPRTPLGDIFNRPIWRFSKVLTILIALGIFLFPAFSMSFTDRIIAVVNKEVITWSDLQKEIQDEYTRLKAKYRGKELERWYNQKQREVLNHLIDDRIQLQEAKAKGFTVTEKEIDAALQRNLLPPTLTKEEFGQQLLLKKLFNFEVGRNIVVEETELRRFYEENPLMFLRPPRYRLKQILLPSTNELFRVGAKKKAQSIYDTWKPDMPIEDLATQYSVPVRELGWVQKGELLPPPLSHVVKDWKPGRLSAPIETNLGFHLIMVVEVRPSQPQPFEEVERDIQALLFKKRSEQAYREWLADLKQKAFIEVKL